MRQAQPLNRKTVLSVIIFLLIAAAGLTYVKWMPYYHKTINAATNHTIGSSIVSGTGQTAPDPSWQAAWDYTKAYYNSVWKAAVLGILLGSLVQVLIPAQWLVRVLGKTSFGSTLIGGAASIPGMMCSCCAAPLAVGLRKKNVSVGASLAFWLGNPTINPATLIFMTFVLSWKFTLIRVIFGLILTFGVSYLANRFAGDAKVPAELAEKQAQALPDETGSWAVRWLKSIWTLTLHIVPAYILAVLLLGFARAWLFPSVSDASANSLLAVIGFAIAGMLFVIPTAGEIPIIQTMMSFGLGGGPAAALLLTLPPVSLPSLLMIYRAYPRKVMLFVTGSVVAIGIMSGIVGMFVL
jgi:uncharacterized membrane protein YraQ (UPF0718 family)